MQGDEFAEEARRREAAHLEAGHTHKIVSAIPSEEGGGNRMSMRAEQAFAERYGLKVDMTRRLNGDGGIDFRLPIGGFPFIVDCKAALIPKELIVPVEDCKPMTIYVLCHYWLEDDCCSLLGWQWGRVLMRSAPKTHGFDVLNYWQDARLIRKMRELDAKAGRT